MKKNHITGLWETCLERSMKTVPVKKSFNKNFGQKKIEKRVVLFHPFQKRYNPVHTTERI